MLDSIEFTQQTFSLKERISTLKHQLELSETLANLDARMQNIDGILSEIGSTISDIGGEPELIQLEQEVNDRLFDLRSVEDQMERIEERLGSDSAEPVDMTLQQTLDVLHQLQQIAETVPGDERLASMGTNVSEGLESFVTSILTGAVTVGEDNQPAPDSPNPGDLTMALEVIVAIQTCPGRDRTSMYNSLRQEFVDAACYAAWKRLDRVADGSLPKALRKQYLHEALSIWMIFPDLSENSGSPRLSQLPNDMYQALQQLFLREVVADIAVGGPEMLVEKALLTKELTEDYLGMIPALAPDAPATLGTQAISSLMRRIRNELSMVDFKHSYETCINATHILSILPSEDSASPMKELSGAFKGARWRLRRINFIRTARKCALPAAAGVASLVALLGVYIGAASLVEALYNVQIPLGALYQADEKWGVLSE